MIQYSGEAQLARAHLLRSFNDLIVFIEDETCQNMHIRVISAILKGEGRISHVFPLGGRVRVIDAALADKGDNPRRIYLIDADLDRLTRRELPACSRLHRILAYNIENLLISETAIVEIATECAVDMDRASLLRSLDYESRKKVVVRFLLPLFEHYAVVARLDLPIPTVSYAVMRLYSQEDGMEQLSRHLVSVRIREVRRKIVAAVGWSAYKRALADVRRAALELEDQSAVISGKDYLLPLVHAYLRSVFKLRDSFNGFRVRLARHFDPDQAPCLRDFVLSALRASFQLKA